MRSKCGTRTAMDRPLKRILSLALVAALAGGVSFLSGCREEGTAEKVGRKIDEGSEEAKRKAKEAGERVEEAVDDLTK